MGLAMTFPALSSLWPNDKRIKSLEAKCSWLTEEKEIFYQTVMQQTTYQQWTTQCLQALSAHGISWGFCHTAKRRPFLNLSHVSVYFYVLNFLPDIMAHAHQHLPTRFARMVSSQEKALARARIKQFQRAANYAQWALVETMLQRLEAWQSSDFVHANPLVIAAQFLPAATFHSPYDSTVLNPFLLPLTAEQCQVFETLVEQKGNERQRERLNKLSWRDASYRESHPHFSLTTRGRGAKQFLIPAQLGRWVPRFRLWPNWLFKGHNFRYDFFKTHRHLLIQCLGFVEGKQIARQGSLSSVAAKHWAKRLQRLQQQLATATKTLNMPRKPHHDWRGINRFKARWYDALQGMQSQLTYTRRVVAQQTARSTEESVKKDEIPNLYALEVAKTLLLEESNISTTTQQAPPITKKTLNTRVYQALDKKTSPNGHYHDGRFRFLLLRLSKAQHFSPQETVFFCQYVKQWQRVNPDKFSAILNERPAVINTLWRMMLNQLTQGPTSPLEYERLVMWQRQITAFTALASTKVATHSDSLALVMRLSLKPFLLFLVKSDLAKVSQRKLSRRWLKTLLPLVLPSLKEEHVLVQRLITLEKNLKATTSPSNETLGHESLNALSTCLSHSLMALQFTKDMQRLQQAIDTHWHATTPLMKPHFTILKQAASKARQYPLTLSKSLSQLIQAEVEQHSQFDDWLELQVMISALQYQGVHALLQQAGEGGCLLKILSPILNRLTLPLVQFDDTLLSTEDLDWATKVSKPFLHANTTDANSGVLNRCHY